MSIETHRVVMGACGWKHMAWLNDFYDDDLPEDWQLGFYSNEFPVVYVPSTDWLVVADLSEWIEDVADSFRFILELPADILNDDAAYRAALLKAQGLGELCLGLVLVIEQTLCDNSSLLQACIEKAKAVSMVCIDTQNVELTNSLNNLLKENAVSSVWHVNMSDERSLSGATFALTRIPSQNVAMPDLRKVLEACLSASNNESISVLIFDGEPPLIETIRNADTLLNLL